MSNPPSTPDQPETSAGKTSRLARWVVFAIVVIVVGLGFYKSGELLSLRNLAKHEASLRQYQQDHPILVYGAAFVIYVTATGFSLPGASVLSLVFAWFFGFWRAFILISFASTTGATIAFLLSRYLLRDAIQSKFGDRLTAFNENLRKEGAFYLFTLRLIPAVPFFVINLVMGLTPLKTSTYWWVSQVGMLPGTAAYVYAGSSFPDLATLAEKGATGILTPKLFAAFVVLGLFPIVVKKILTAVKARKASAAVDA